MDDELSDWEEMAERDYDSSEKDCRWQGMEEETYNDMFSCTDESDPTIKDERYSLNGKSFPYDPNIITHKDLLKPTAR